VFISQKKSVYTVQQINRKLKAVFSKEAKELNISSHSLRKSFGRRVYETNNESEKALNYLSELFNHTSLAVTRRYLGIRQEELNNIYLSL
jgi:site-specific recombinase XerD